MEAQIANNAMAGTDASTDTVYVGFWARVLASIIDTIWLTIVLVIVIGAFFGQEYLTGAMMAGDPAAASAAASGAAMAFAVQFILPIALILAFWIYKSATPGKMVISAEIVDAKTMGKPSVGQFIVRYIGYYISAFVFMLGFLWVAFDKRKQGWHDKIAGTLVVKK
jgi:uncharacterized RDD family membrane protein YckC